MYTLTKANGTIKLTLSDSCSISDIEELTEKLSKMTKKSKRVEISFDDGTELDTSHLQVILSIQRSYEAVVTNGEAILNECRELYGV
ncbi:MAG: hypothetical protein N2738_00975 [Thermodesulfovibrionales bacterium]|nr:hypothetical protein [Thermodesulfovibrionales bacterium]